jgi:hypothetical protein
MGGVTTQNMYSSLHKYNKLYIVASCWTTSDNFNYLEAKSNLKYI